MSGKNVAAKLLAALVLILSIQAVPAREMNGAPAQPEASGVQTRGQSADPGFWGRDVWRDPERPFLFYGSSESEKNDARRAPSGVSAAPLKDLEDLTTLEALQAEVKARLSRAVMDPSSENMTAYLEANAFLMAKAGAFAESWRASLLQHPAYDWTAQHPTVNFASTELSRLAARRVTEAVSGMKNDWGFVFFGDDSELTRLMLPLVKDFSDRHGFETVYVSMVRDNPLMPGARPDRGEASRIAGGLTYFPALVLVHREDRDLSQARLAATGVVDIAELGRRVMRLAQEREDLRSDPRTVLRASAAGGLSADGLQDWLARGAKKNP